VATTLALVGLTLAVQRWAASPLPHQPWQGPSAQGRLQGPPPAGPQLPPARPSPAPRQEPAARAAAVHPRAGGERSALSEGPAVAPAAPGLEPLAQEEADTARQDADAEREEASARQEADAAPVPDADAARREVRALVLAAARELAVEPAAEPPVTEPPRDAAQLQPVPLETGLPRVEPGATIDLATGAGLEASQPLPAQQPVSHPPLDADDLEPEADDDAAPQDP